MPQAAVPDVNVVLIKLFDSMMNAVRANNSKEIVSSIKYLNGILPKDLRLNFVPKEQYDTETKAKSYLICDCGKEITFDNIQKVKPNIATSYSENTIKFKPKRVIICECGKITNMENLVKLNVVIEKPDLFSLSMPISEPPKYVGMESYYYNEDFRQWRENVMTILMDRIKRFRDSVTIEKESQGVIVE